jgi:hypothetical protein
MIDSRLRGLNGDYRNTFIEPIRRLIEQNINFGNWHKVYTILSIASKMGCIEASLIIAAYLFGKKKYEDAYRHALLAHEANHSRGTYIMGLCELVSNKKRRGLYHLQKAESANDKDAMLTLCRLYTVNDNDKAIHYMSRLIDCYPAEYCLYLGCYHIRKGTINDAMRYLNISAKHNCSLAYCLYGICDLLINIWPGKKSKKYLKKSKDMDDMEGTFFYGTYLSNSYYYDYKGKHYKRMARENGIEYNSSVAVRIFTGSPYDNEFHKKFKFQDIRFYKPKESINPPMQSTVVC